MNAVSILAVAGLSLGLAQAQLPDPYRNVHYLTWVVSDLDRVDTGWSELGFDKAVPLQDGVLEQDSPAGPVRLDVQVAAGRLGEYRYLRIQPGDGNGPYSAFLERHRDGVFALNHRFPSVADLESEVRRLEQLGVSVLDRGRLKTPQGELTYVHMDTAREGKYVLGLVCDSGVFDNLEATSPFRMRASQYALVVRDLNAVSAFWVGLGFPPMEVTHPALTDLTYYGEPGRFDQELGWHRHGEIAFEWIRPLRGPTTYEDSLDRHGEGFHHIAFNVEDIDAAVAYFEARGIRCSQAGGWGEKGKPGSGRFAYVDTDALGGLTVELLWNFQTGSE